MKKITIAFKKSEIFIFWELQIFYSSRYDYLLQFLWLSLNLANGFQANKLTEK